MANPYPKNTLWYFDWEEKERQRQARQAIEAARRSVPRASADFRRAVVERERRRQDDELFAPAITHPSVRRRLIRPLPSSATYGQAMQTVRDAGFASNGAREGALIRRDPGAAAMA